MDGMLFVGDLCNNLKCVIKEMNDVGFFVFNIGLELEFFFFEIDENGNMIIKVND